MFIFDSKICTVAIMLLLNLITTLPAQAHLMVPQHGSLNVVDNAIFMVLSLPISGFKGVDDNLDGKLSLNELNTHRASIIKDVSKFISIKNETEITSLEGIMLSPVVSHHQAEEPASQLIVMGKFTIKSRLESSYFCMKIFGNETFEQVMNMRIKRKSDGLKNSFELTPNNDSVRLF